MENKNDIEIIETSEVVKEEPKKQPKAKKQPTKIKNQALFKRGGYSLAITALVLAALIIFNWLVSSLASRFHLEFDMTTVKKNSISQDNIDYLKNLNTDVDIIVCSTEEDYPSYMLQFAQAYYMIATDSNTIEYFQQTTKLISKYTEYNDRIKVEYIDPQSTRFTALSSIYSNYQPTYGDMIITSKVGDKERTKLLRFEDIYFIKENTDSSYTSYSPTRTIESNKLETALTSAIAYVTSTDSKKVAILSGHSNNNFTDAYKSLLEINNYSMIEVSDKIITSIPSECDAIVISAPTTDFIGEELDLISEFLDNNGKKGKGLIYFADATCPSLPNLNSYLKQWGIEVSEGVVFETDGNRYISGEPTTIVIEPVLLEDDDITADLGAYSIANYNVPMKACDASSYERTATVLMQTSESAVIAPVGSGEEWADFKNEDKQQFGCVIQSLEEDIDPNNNESLTSYVMAFSSVEFVQSQWASYGELSNQDIVMACSDRATHVGDTSMKFVAKVIDNESFSNQVTQNSIKVVNAVFVFIIPLVIIALGIVIFIRRRNAR